MERELGNLDVVLAGVSRACLLLAVAVGGFASFATSGARFALSALLLAASFVLMVREQRRLAQFGGRVEARHPGLLGEHGVRSEGFWRASPVIAYTGVVRDQSVSVDAALATEAGRVATMAKVHWAIFIVAISGIAFVLGRMVLGSI